MNIDSALLVSERSIFWRPLIGLFFSLTLVTGLLYPLVVTGFAAVFFPDQAAGSLVRYQGQMIGSRLIGQNFKDPKYFWGRLSATSPMNDNASASSGSNYGPLSPALFTTVQGRIQALRSADPGNDKPVPVDLVTASASGLDPEISLAAAEYQLNRVARARHKFPAWVQQRVDAQSHGVWGGFLGEPRVNVLLLNLSLDSDQSH